jgi:hypothetical protein
LEVQIVAIEQRPENAEDSGEPFGGVAYRAPRRIRGSAASGASGVVEQRSLTRGHAFGRRVEGVR